MLRQVTRAQQAANGRWSLSESPTDPQVYIVTFIPPEGSMYCGGMFLAEITLKNYPIYPPRVRMITKIFHPNFSQQQGHVGLMYVDILYGDYQRRFTVLDLIEYIYGLFAEPDSDSLSQCNSTASELYKKDPEQFKAIAQEWTKNYAL